MRSLLVALPLLLVGCAVDVDVPVDGDRDGLISTEELDANTDPQNPDSDGDGHADGVEVSKGFDPNDPDSYPYTGEYVTDVGCRDEPHQATGNEVGDITQEFAGQDQFGDNVRSLDFCNKVILLKAGAFW